LTGECHAQLALQQFDADDTIIFYSPQVSVITPVSFYSLAVHTMILSAQLPAHSPVYSDEHLQWQLMCDEKRRPHDYQDWRDTLNEVMAKEQVRLHLTEVSICQSYNIWKRMLPYLNAGNMAWMNQRLLAAMTRQDIYDAVHPNRLMSICKKTGAFPPMSPLKGIWHSIRNRPHMAPRVRWDMRSWYHLIQYYVDKKMCNLDGYTDKDIEQLRNSMRAFADHEIRMKPLEWIRDWFKTHSFPGSSMLAPIVDARIAQIRFLQAARILSIYTPLQ
jgi:hypothetical protein